MTRSVLAGCCCAAAALRGLAGCGSPTAEFRRYETFAHKVADAA